MRRKSSPDGVTHPLPSATSQRTSPANGAADSARRPRGRPRSVATRERARVAAYELLCERGFAAVTYEAVATRAGVARTTLYRHWPDRAALVVDAFFTATAEQLSFAESGSAREDFRQQIHALAALLRGPVGAAIVAMVGAMHDEPTIMAALRERWLVPRQRWGFARLTRAQANGECRDGLQIPAALAALYGPIYSSLFLGIGAPDAAMVDAYFAVVGVGVFQEAGALNQPNC